MSELHDLLHEAEPATATFSPAEVRLRAERIRRRSRGQVAAVAVVMVGVIAGAVLVTRPEATVQVITPALSTEALSVFEGPVVDLLPDAEPPGRVPGARLAREIDDVRYLVGPSPLGGVCPLVVYPGGRYSPPGECPAVPSAQAVMTGDGVIRAVFVVPDGVDTVTWRGITSDVEGNVASLRVPPDIPVTEATGPGSPVQIDLSGAVLAGSGMDTLYTDRRGTAVVDLDWLEDIPSADAPLAQRMDEVLGASDPPRSASPPDVYAPEVVGPWQFVLARATGDRLCLASLGDAPEVVDQVRCVVPHAELPPFVATLQLARPENVGWAAVVPTDHDALRLADGRTYPIIDHLLVVPDLDGLPVSGTLIGPPGAQVVTIGVPSQAERDTDLERPLGRPTAPDLPVTPVDIPVQGEALSAFDDAPGAAPAGVRLPTADWPTWEITRQGPFTIHLTPLPGGRIGMFIERDGQITIGAGRPIGSFVGAQAGDERIAVAVVPDGYDRLELQDGRTVEVTSNLAIVEGTTGEELRGAFTDPAGRLDVHVDGSRDGPELAVLDRTPQALPDQIDPATLTRQPPIDADWTSSGQLAPPTGDGVMVETPIGAIAVLQGPATTHESGPVCLAGPDQTGAVSCALRQTGAAYPVIVARSVDDADGTSGWAALVSDDWTQLVTDGQTYDVHDNIVVIPDINGRPRTMSLHRADGSAEPVSVASWPAR